MSAHLRPESYPLLSDFEHDDVEPAPDGRPWRKACPECAFRTTDPQGMGAGYLDAIRYRPGDTVFYCVHRMDRDHHRICACFAACRAGEARHETGNRRLWNLLNGLPAPDASLSRDGD